MKLELMDLVNENDEVIGIIDRNDKAFNGKKNIRGVNLFLLTKENKVVVPKRSGNRRIFPNCYDFSVAGMVDSGEDYETAMYRETKEELLLEDVTLKEFAYLNPFKDESSMFLKLYVGYIDREIKDFDRNGISDIFYLTLKEIDKLLKDTPEAFKTSYKMSFELLKEYLNKNNK